MAFAARTGALVEELVEALIGSSAQTDPKTFNRSRDVALRALRSHQYLRTNQFDVRDRLDGLEERFRVNDRDSLADALSNSRSALEQTPSQHHPEILFLLLELSDQPTFKSKLGDVEALRSVEEEAVPALRWRDIAREDGWDQDADIWRTVRFENSSEDGSEDEQSTHESDLTATTDDEVGGRPPEDFIINPQDIPLLNSIREAQQWRLGTLPRDGSGNTRKTAVPESHILRDVLFMLQGLDTTLFDTRGTPNLAFQMSHIAWETHKALINSFAETGRRLLILRVLAGQMQTSPHLQVFQDGIIKRLGALDSRIAEIQTRLASPDGQVVVSLIAVKRELSPCLEPLCALASIVDQCQDTSNSGPFRYLELLFDEATVAQLSGRSAIYEFLARIFVECFNVYLRPIRYWMDEGRLLSGDEVFFVSESPETVPLSGTWADRFKLRQSADGVLHAPVFLHPAAAKIFNAGKNIVVLKQLGKYGNFRAQSSGNEPPLDYDAICPKGFDMAPFSELFRAAFDAWIQSKYRKTSESLHNALFNDCGLPSALDALQYLHFMSDGSAAASFCQDLFGKIEALGVNQLDKYALTVIGQEIFASILDSSRLTISLSSAGQFSASTGQSSLRTALPGIKIAYRLTWPVQMVLAAGSIAQYQSVFTLLLQIRRAMHSLHKSKILDNYWTDHENWGERAMFYSARRNLIWFCTTLQTYLSTLVFEPNVLKMRHDLRVAQDVDAMISIHAMFVKQIIDEACLGSRLAPIHGCILDMLDLAVTLDDTQLTDATGGSHDEAMLRKRKRDRPSWEVLGEIQKDFERHLRFICGGLRSVARATSDSQSAKWDILAEMLQTGQSG